MMFLFRMFPLHWIKPKTLNTIVEPRVPKWEVRPAASKIKGSAAHVYFAGPEVFFAGGGQVAGTSKTPVLGRRDGAAHCLEYLYSKRALLFHSLDLLVLDLAGTMINSPRSRFLCCFLLGFESGQDSDF